MKRPDAKERDRKDRPGELNQYWSLSSLGIEIGLSFGVGAFIGYYLDRTFGTEPWLIIAFSFFGILAGFRNIIRLARKDWDGEKTEKGDSAPGEEQK